jgi:putative spermidine/putrescine transport system permease protein
MICSLLLVVPTAYWVQLRLPKLRPYVEFVTLMPFVVPAVVLIFGLIRIYGRPPLVLTTTPAALIVGYIVLSLPYMYRSVDSGLRAVDIRTLTEAAQSLGANWLTIIKDVILPNLRVALLSGMFLTFAIVMGEFTFASLLSWPAFGPYIEEIGSMRAYTPQAVSVMSFAVTWLSIAGIQWLGRGAAGQVQTAGAR